MRWDAHQIANVARAAGFDHADTVTATAVALATSGGLDHYDYSPGSPGSGRYVGLWGIDTDRWPWYRSRPLEVPAVSARTVWELCRDHRGWHWSPTYEAGSWQHFVDYAGTEATRTHDGQIVGAPVTLYDNRHRYADTIARIRAERATLPVGRLKG